MPSKIWVALCPICKIVWPLSDDKRFLEHPKEALPQDWYQEWRARWAESDVGVMEAFRVMPSDPGYEAAQLLVQQSNDAHEAQLAELREKRVWCEGNGLLVGPNDAWLNENTCKPCGLGPTGHAGCSGQWAVPSMKARVA
jgi:hypothetical protein